MHPVQFVVVVARYLAKSLVPLPEPAVRVERVEGIVDRVEEPPGRLDAVGGLRRRRRDRLHPTGEQRRLVHAVPSDEHVGRPGRESDVNGVVVGHDRERRDTGERLADLDERVGARLPGQLADDQSHVGRAQRGAFDGPAFDGNDAVRFVRPRRYLGGLPNPVSGRTEVNDRANCGASWSHTRPTTVANKNVRSKLSISGTYATVEIAV